QRGGIIAPLSAARTAQRAVPTKFRVQSAKISWNSFHEPPLSRPSATLSPPCGERAGRGVPIWFMVPMRAQKRKEAFHEPQGRAGCAQSAAFRSGCECINELGNR